MSDHAHPLHRIMNPRSIVIAGASPNIMKMGSLQALTLLSSGFTGEVTFLHPSAETVLGKRAYRNPAELPETPDLAMLVTPTRATIELLDQLGEAGVRRAVIITAGFREIGEEGTQLQEELETVAQRHGIRYLGPNCIGIINTHHNLNLTVFPYRDRPGRLGLISQSGTYVAQIMPYLRERGIRYSQAISVGNAANLDEVDCLEYLGEDPNTEAIAIYIEGIRRGRDFLEVARRVARNKPIVALFVGGSAAGARAGLSHTGTMGGPDLLYEGLFEQSGVIRANSVAELFAWSHALASMPLPKSRRMAILTHSGGPASSMADACERQGLELPEFSPALQQTLRAHSLPTASVRNPIDLTFTLDHKTFSLTLPEILFNSDEIDGILLHGMMDSGFVEETFEIFKPLLSLRKEDLKGAVLADLSLLESLPKATGKPLVASTFLSQDQAAQTFIQQGIPLFDSPENAVKAMAALVKAADIQMRLQNEPQVTEPEQIPSSATASHRLPPGLMDEFDAKQLLAKYSIDVVPEELVSSLKETNQAALNIGYPVVLKGLPEGVAHKSDAGLVHLDLRSPEELLAAWQAIEQRHPACRKVVAAMLRGQRELLVGMTRFPGFGPCLMLGIGGVFTEVIRDVTFRLPPLSRNEILRMPNSLRLGRLLEAHRGLPAIDPDRLVQTIEGVSRLVIEHPEIAELDINPLIIVNGRPIAVDALIVVDKR